MTFDVRLPSLRAIAALAVSLTLVPACGGSSDEGSDAGPTQDDSSPGDGPAVDSQPAPGPDAKAPDGQAAVDASSPDAGVDAGEVADAGVDATTNDTGVDATANDTGVDSTAADASDGATPPADTGVDSTVDASTEDASDATVPPDGAVGDGGAGDGSLDAGIDAEIDAGLDATVDAGTDGSAPGDDAGDAEADAFDAAAIDAADSAIPEVVHFVPGVTVTTIAGSDARGEQDGVGDAATFNNPTGLSIDHQGNLLVVDYDGWTVRHVTPSGGVTTIGSSPGFTRPFATIVADDGTYFVSTDDDPDSAVKTPTSGAVWLVPSWDGGLATPVPIHEGLSRPRGLAPAGDAGLFVVSRLGQIVGTLDVTTGAFSFVAGTADAGFSNGSGGQAAFDLPVGAARTPLGTFVVADGANGAIREVALDGTVTTIAGNGTLAMVDGTCDVARFGSPRDVAVDAAGHIYVTDGVNQRVRRIRRPAGTCIVETIAGSGVTGFADGTGDAAAFFGEEGIDVTPDGTTIYVADGDLGSGAAYHRIRAIQVPALDAGQ